MQLTLWLLFFLVLAHPLHRAGAQPRGKILRPNLGVPAGLAGARGEGPRSASDRREEEAYSARVKEKMKLLALPTLMMRTMSNLLSGFQQGSLEHLCPLR